MESNQIFNDRFGWEATKYEMSKRGSCQRKRGSWQIEKREECLMALCMYVCMMYVSYK